MANTEQLLRLIQSIPSPKAEPFKLWLAQVGYERLEEIENPELAAKRTREIYEQKGYSEEWIEKRLRGIAVRDELTDEWKKRGVKEQKEFAILTAEISKATFASVPCDSGMILSPRQISLQFVDAEWTHYAALAKQLLESQPAHACKLRSLARGERPSRIERDRHFLEQLGSHLLTWNVHRFRRGIGNFERQLHGGVKWVAGAPKARIQWGRGLSTAETCASSLRSKRKITLQRGRGLGIAENVSPQIRKLRG